MRQLLVLRHAKSDWDAGVADHERPLNHRGRRSAALIGEHVARAGLVPDLALCSTAVRARTTLALAAEAGGWDTTVEHTRALYGTDVTGTLATVAAAPDVDALLLVGHEPTWSSLVHLLSGAAVQMKTATLVVLELDRGGWADLEPRSCSIVSVTQVRHLAGT